MDVLLVLLDYVGVVALLLQTELKSIGFGIAAGAGTIGAGVGMGYLFGQYISSISRQPEAEDQVRVWLFVGIGLIEAFALYGLVFGFLVQFLT
ncbi:MAG: ATP synthase F0 subunit C [Actinobacteria bacterium]|nr:ATP synthase F0 subunit C [Actinomycetota bacterium]